MRKITLSAVCLIALITGCQTTEVEQDECQPVTAVTVEDPCSTVYTGLTLVASGFKVPKETAFQWYVYPQKDTLSNDVTQSRGWLGQGQERILTPDTVIKNAPKIVVQVRLLCRGKAIESLYFPIVKRKTSNPACDVWRPQKL